MHRLYPEKMQCNSYHVNGNVKIKSLYFEQIHVVRAGATSPVGQVSTGPLFSPSTLTADLGDYDVRGSIDE